MRNELYKMVFSFVTVLITSGSFGYINYNILDKLNVIVDRPNDVENDKKYKVLLFTGINIGLYWILSSLKMKVSVSILFVLLFDVLGTICIIAPAIKLIDFLINKKRVSTGQSETLKVATRDYLFNSNKPQATYIYDFDNNLISCGWLDYQQTADNGYFDVTLTPFSEEGNNGYEDVSEYARDKSPNSKMLVDFEKNIKIIVIQID
ncbi:hypothetical protein L1O48_00690 [Ligilactobacillus equi]|uniref:hypothetical protein n=1 Tax=Ligilactobacillus equi TaxID=137357 RepID=UPI002ED3BC75